MPYLVMTYFAIVQNHTLQHFKIYPFFCQWRVLFVFFFAFWVFFLPSTATYMQFYQVNDYYFSGMKDEKRGKEIQKKGFESEKRRKLNGNLCISKNKSNTENTH